MNKKIDKNSLKWVIKNSSCAYIKILLLTVLTSTFAVLGVKIALAYRGVIDAATGQSGESWVHNAIILCAILVLQLIISAIIKSLEVRATGRLTISLKNKIFKEILLKNWKDVSAYHSGELLNRINNDVAVIVTGVITLVPAFIGLLTRLVEGFRVMFTLDARFSVAVLIMGPFVMLLSRLYSKKMKGFHKKCQECDGKTSSFMQESIQNILMVKSFSSEDYMAEKAKELQETGYRVKLKRNSISILAHVGLSLVFSSGSSLALIWGAYNISIGLMTFGTLMAFVQIINQIQTPFMQISSLLPQFYNMLASSERIMELEEIKDEEGTPVSDISELYSQMKSIKISGISFAYDKENILTDTSYNIEKGKFIAIAGDSGAGKSTLLKLILGIIEPANGEISVVTDKEEIPVSKSVRGLFAYVPQGNMILSGTIRDNIKFACDFADDTRIKECAKAACIWDLIEEQENGLDTVLGERGLGLSEGQVQRLAIARALLYDAPILLLDEATSALDEKTEASVLENIRKLKDKTCIIISHKKAAFSCADEIIAIDNEKIINISKE